MENVENLSDKCRKVSSTCYIIYLFIIGLEHRFVGFSELRVYLFKKPEVIPSWRIVLDPSLEERKLFFIYKDSDAFVQVTVHFRYSSTMHARTRESKRLKR